jgi:hypothetical protein
VDLAGREAKFLSFCRLAGVTLTDYFELDKSKDIGKTLRLMAYERPG